MNQTMWMDVLRFYDAFAKAVKPHGIKTTAAVMCTANVTSPSLCKNGLPYFNDSATPGMVSMMRSSAVERWISMGTYGIDPPTTVNQIDWFIKTLGADRFGLGTAQVLAPVGDDSDLLLRFSLANAYDIAEIDLFDYETSSLQSHAIALATSPTLQRHTSIIWSAFLVRARLLSQRAKYGPTSPRRCSEPEFKTALGNCILVWYRYVSSVL